MAKKTLQTSNEKVVFQLGDQITIKTLNRQREDIGKWRAALKSAENISSPNRVALYTIYSDILLDSHLKSVWGKRKNSILNRRIKFVKKDGTEDEVAKEIIGRQWFRKMLDYTMDAIGWGHSLIEFGMAGSEIVTVKLVERRNVSPERGMILKEETDTTGILYREPPNCYYVLEVGDANDFGLFLQAAVEVLYKRGSKGDLAQFLEIFGMPFRKYVYDGHDERTRVLLEDAAQKAGAAGYVVIPKDSNVEFLTNTTNSGGTGGYKDMIQMCNEALSILFLGNTMTTEDGSSKSQAEVHADSENDINEADKIWIESILNNDARNVLVGLGLSIFSEGTFLVDEPMNVDKEIERDKKLSEIVDIDPTYFEKKYGRPVLGLKNNAGVLPGKPKGAAG